MLTDPISDYLTRIRNGLSSGLATVEMPASKLKRVSRPGRRRYVRHSGVPRVHGGTGTAIVTTSHGVMTGHDANKEGVGGEVVAYVW